ARIRRVDCSTPGFTRRRQGRGFVYRDQHGQVVRDPQVLARLKALTIPPAWKDVWICPDPAGHLQAVGTDAAGRRQYLYHERWRASVVDPPVAEVVAALKQRSGGGPELLAYRQDGAWVDLRSEDINDWIKQRTGGDFSAKDFRTWSATVLAAVAMATSWEAAR